MKIRDLLKTLSKILTRTIKIRDLRIDFKFPSEQDINSLLGLGQKLSLIIFSFLTPLNYWFIFGVLFLLFCDISIEDEILEGE